MKKLLIVLLAISVIVGLAACSSDSDTSSDTATSAGGTSSTAGTSSEATSSEESTSSTTSEESEPEPELPYEVAANITQFVSWGGTIGTGLTGAKATDATALQLTAVNQSPTDDVASVIAFTFEYGGSIASDDGSYDDYNILSFAYDHSAHGYLLTASIAADDDADKDSTEIPDDGYVLAVHYHWQAKVDAILATEEGTVFYPHGFRITDALDATISEGTATIDGKVDEDEYGAPVWEIDPSFIYASYEQFGDALDVDILGKVYMMYDSEYLYVGVVVDSPNHYCPNDAGQLWRYDAIQLNVISIDPQDEYITGSSKWNVNTDGSASSENILRQYGFGVSNDGNSLSTMWFGAPAVFGGTTVSTRDDSAQVTIYEAAIPLSECGATDATIAGEKGTVIGVSLSLNQGDEESWQNVFLRDGGSVIGLNDLTKAPTITFG